MFFLDFSVWTIITFYILVPSVRRRRHSIADNNTITTVQEVSSTTSAPTGKSHTDTPPSTGAKNMSPSSVRC